MREFAFVMAGIAAGIVWLAIWAGFLQVFGIAPGLRNVEDSVSKRERLNRLGKLKYILIFGVLGYGLAFGLAMITVDLVSYRSQGWASELTKLLLFTVCIGLFQGLWGWHRAFRDPVPFPPDYPPAK
jgi:uncharacterized membrane protein